VPAWPIGQIMDAAYDPGVLLEILKSIVKPNQCAVSARLEAGDPDSLTERPAALKGINGSLRVPKKD
jgi:hypothetical protein